MISCHHLRKTYGRRTVVDDVSFDVPAGQITGLLGPNGSGKTTILKGILGLTRMDGGEIVVDPSTMDVTCGRPVGASLDITGFRREMRLRDVVRGAGMRHGRDVDADALLRHVGLTDPRQRVGTLSLGMTQRLRIAMALVVPPCVLVLDEPLNGLDPQGIRWFRGLLREHADAGGAVLLSSHLLNEAERIVDKVVVIDGGVVRAEGPLTSYVGPGSTLEDSFFATTLAPEGLS
jgi:ABC-2 type transport system ATP-binding protein